jgi:hypothetical protein
MDRQGRVPVLSSYHREEQLTTPCAARRMSHGSSDPHQHACPFGGLHGPAHGGWPWHHRPSSPWRYRFLRHLYGAGVYRRGGLSPDLARLVVIDDSGFTASSTGPGSVPPSSRPLVSSPFSQHFVVWNMSWGRTRSVPHARVSRRKDTMRTRDGWSVDRRLTTLATSPGAGAVAKRSRVSWIVSFE